MISAIVVSYHTGDILFTSLNQLLSQSLIGEIILVNNGNPEGFIEQAHQIDSNKIKLISGHGNIGFGKACNLGAKAAQGEYLLFINPDCVISDEQMLNHMIEYFKQHPRILLAGCLITNDDGSEQRGCRRKLLTPTNVFTFNLNNTPLPESIAEVEAISGAFMFYRAKDFKMINGFDEHYFLHVEDLDICHKIKIIGGKIAFFPMFKVTHLLSTSDAPKKFIEYHKLKGLFYYFNKYYGNKFSTKIINLLLAIRFIFRFGAISEK